MSKKYGTIITDVGAALIAQCILEGKVLPITEAAAGDGNGAYYEPTTDQIALRRECWRGDIAGFTLSEYAPNMLDVKIIIDDEVGGFTIREMGLFSEGGTLIAICNTPDTEKISISGGIPGRLTMIMHIIVADASVIEITINPELDVVTPEQLAAEIAKHNSDENAHAGLFAAPAHTHTVSQITDFPEIPDIPAPTAFSVDVSAWTELAELVAGCGYSAEIAAEGVTAADYPDVYFDENSLEAAAGIVAGTAEGKVVLYAKTAPATALSGAYFIRKGSAV